MSKIQKNLEFKIFYVPLHRNRNKTMHVHSIIAEIVWLAEYNLAQEK